MDEGDRILSVNGIVRSHVLNGVCTALYSDNEMNIKYRYKVSISQLAFVSVMGLGLLPHNSSIDTYFTVPLMMDICCIL